LQNPHKKPRKFGARLLWLASAGCLLVGCSKLHPRPTEEVAYLEQKDAYLRDHVAAVSNRTGHVVNGEKLVILEHGRRFVRVRDARNETGWLEERYVVGQPVWDAFQKLREDSNPLTPVATATVRDDVAMHIAPGRETDHLFMLKEGDKVQLLRRASTLKPVPAQAMPLKNASPPPPLPASTRPESQAKKEDTKKHGPAPIAGAPTVPMEDWWLVRDAEGRVGWVLGRRFDVDVPDTIAGYAENQRFVAVYMLTTVYDADAQAAEAKPTKARTAKPGPPAVEPAAAPAATPAPPVDPNVPVYLTLLAPYRDGLPYDFSTARVFSWNTKKHRYESAFRSQGLWGYLPAVVGKDFYPQGTEPTFTLHFDPAKAGTIDASTGLPVHGPLDNMTYRMEGEVLKKVQPASSVSAQSAAPKAASGASEEAPHRGTRHR